MTKIFFSLYDFLKKNYDILCTGSNNLTVKNCNMITEYHNFFIRREIFSSFKISNEKAELQILNTKNGDYVT